MTSYCGPSTFVPVEKTQQAGPPRVWGQRVRPRTPVLDMGPLGAEIGNDSGKGEILILNCIILQEIRVSTVPVKENQATEKRKYKENGRERKEGARNEGTRAILSVWGGGRTEEKVGVAEKQEMTSETLLRVSGRCQGETAGAQGRKWFHQ